MTEKEKMLAGHIYDACNPEILRELFTTQDAVFEYNQIRPTDHALRTEKIKQILGKTGERIIVNQPFHCDYGSHISVGEDFFANFNLTVLDEAPVTIGDNCFIGPNVGLYTACHPTNPVARNSPTGVGRTHHHRSQCVDWWGSHCLARCHHWRQCNHRCRKCGGEGHSQQLRGSGQSLSSGEMSQKE